MHTRPPKTPKAPEPQTFVSGGGALARVSTLFPYGLDLRAFGPSELRVGNGACVFIQHPFMHANHFGIPPLVNLLFGVDCAYPTTAALASTD
jgi:hypothetical protein